MRGGRKRKYTKPVHLPYTRIRTVIVTKQGDVRSFIVKLEYNVADEPAVAENWNGVARFDHNPDGEDGHDIREEGLHMDLCEPGEEDKRAWGFPEKTVSEAPAFCEEYFEENHLRLTKRYCKKYGLNDWNRPTRR